MKLMLLVLLFAGQVQAKAVIYYNVKSGFTTNPDKADIKFGMTFDAVSEKLAALEPRFSSEKEKILSIDFSCDSASCTANNGDLMSFAFSNDRLTAISTTVKDLDGVRVYLNFAKKMYGRGYMKECSITKDGFTAKTYGYVGTPVKMQLTIFTTEGSDNGAVLVDFRTNAFRISFDQPACQKAQAEDAE